MTLAGKRVLVVEDEMLITLEIVDELKNAGCTVIGPGRRLEAAIALARERGIGRRRARREPCGPFCVAGG